MLPAPLLRGALLRTAKAGRLATAVRFGNRLAPLAGRHLTGQKGLGRPLQSDLRPAGVFAFSMNDERPTMNVKSAVFMRQRFFSDYNLLLT